MADRPARIATGFTLIEVLVVMFIIGIIVSFAVLNIDDRAGDDRLQREAERLQALMQAAADDAVLYGVEVGLDMTRDGYRFLRLDKQGWQPITRSDNPLRARKLEAPMHLELLQEDSKKAERVGSNKDKQDDNKENGLRPEVLFLSSGEITPFKLELSADNAQSRYTFTGKLTGQLKMTRHDKAP